MKYFSLLALLFAVFVAPSALAQSITITPTTATFDWRAQTTGNGVLVGSVALVPCSVTEPTAADFVSVATVSTPSGGDVIVSGTASIDMGAGDQCLRGVAVSTTGTISDPSENDFQILLKPLGPMLLPPLDQLP